MLIIREQILRGFQFLLGRLETCYAGRLDLIAIMFQFLLGRLETFPIGAA